MGDSGRLLVMEDTPSRGGKQYTESSWRNSGKKEMKHESLIATLLVLSF